MKRTPDNQELHDSMMARCYTQTKQIKVKGVLYEADVTMCPPYDPRVIAGFETGKNIADLLNVSIKTKMRPTKED